MGHHLRDSQFLIVNFIDFRFILLSDLEIEIIKYMHTCTLACFYLRVVTQYITIFCDIMQLYIYE